jgi:hypothetical protein
MIGEIVQSKGELGLLRDSIIMVESPVSRKQGLRALTNCFQQGLSRFEFPLSIQRPLFFFFNLLG